MRVAPASIDDDQVRDLLMAHQRDMHAISPPGTSFALDLSAFAQADIALFGAWEDEILIAVGALKRLGDGQAEIKSMRTRSDYLGKGAGRAILERLVDLAKQEGIRRVSLETGTSDRFLPAVRLYTRHGFKPGDAYAGYANGPHNQCYHLELKP